MSHPQTAPTQYRYTKEQLDMIDLVFAENEGRSHHELVRIFQDLGIKRASNTDVDIYWVTHYRDRYRHRLTHKPKRRGRPRKIVMRDRAEKPVVMKTPSITPALEEVMNSNLNPLTKIALMKKLMVNHV
jgi:hypothetical protein